MKDHLCLYTRYKHTSYAYHSNMVYTCTLYKDVKANMEM